MKVVIQRVKTSSVAIDGQIYSSIKGGMMVLVGVQDDDKEEDIRWLTQKISALRIFNDSDGVMNLSIKEAGGEILAVSQFTLMARVKKGNRPSYINAAKPDIAIPVYERFLQQLKEDSGCDIKTGVFGADMEITLVNDGPVTIIIDTKNRM